MNCRIETTDGQVLEVALTSELDGTAATTIYVNGVPCHLEWVAPERVRESQVDDDPAYTPQVDGSGRTFWLVPFAQG